jgi:acetyltransferase-like isoleucine patch superfamily enzyme
MLRAIRRGKLEIGKYSYVASNLKVISRDKTTKVTIGKFCSIGGGVTLMTFGCHNTDWVTTYPFGHVHKGVFHMFDGTGHPKKELPIVIGNDVWIGGNVTIIGGVTVGDGAVIAANSHVVKDVAPYAIVGGNPAKFIRSRFEHPIPVKLQMIKWWNWSEKVINEMTPYLCSPDMSRFFEEVKKRGL